MKSTMLFVLVSVWFSAGICFGDSERAKSLDLASTNIQMAPVSGGCFEMGDTFGNDRGDELPVHRVCVSDFSIGKYEVTQGQWKAVMGEVHKASKFKQGDDYPVDSVEWNEIQRFIAALNRLTHSSYRLPTEAEWEYAARSGGQREKWPGTSDESALGEYAWYDKNSGNEIHPVGLKNPNGLGLYDMAGNISEVCQDWYGPYSSGQQDNPKGPRTGSKGPYHVSRGGEWRWSARHVRATIRALGDVPNLRYYGGLRLARSIR